MNKKLIGNCPICGEKLVVTELTCRHCDTAIKGDFQLSRFDYLTEEQKSFALTFIKNKGNIKAIEREMGISYPTVKKNLDDLITSLGFTVKVEEEKMTKEQILKALKQKEITFEEAEKMLEEIEYAK